MKPTCLKCTKVNNIPKCLDELVVGTISSTNTDVYIVLESSTGRIITFTATSDGAGLVKLDTTDFEPNQVFNYNLWVSLQSNNIYDAEDLTIEGETDPVKCVSFKFDTVYNGNGSVISFASQKIEVCA